MVAASRTAIYGEIFCLNCGRNLGEVVRDPDSGELRIRRSRRQRELLVEIVDGRQLRCLHCQGRAFVEPVLLGAPLALASGRQAVDPLLGAA